MATFSFSNKNSNTTASNAGIKRNVKIALIKHEGQEPVPEYYSYTNGNGEKCKYSGIVVTDLDGSYIGKTITTHKVILDYHPTVESVEHVDEYFSYKDNYGRERIFIGEPKFDLESNSYYGEVTEDILHDEIVTIFKEK